MSVRVSAIKASRITNKSFSPLRQKDASVLLEKIGALCSQRGSVQFTEECSPVIKRLHECPSCAEQPWLIPVLQAASDNLPFSMSLELCTGTVVPPDQVQVSTPVFELLYFLHGSGEASVQSPGTHGQPWKQQVSAGDSVFAPLHSITVAAGKDNDSASLAYLRVYLPVKYVLEDVVNNKLIVSECRKAAADATSHWAPRSTSFLSESAVQSILDNAKEIPRIHQAYVPDHAENDEQSPSIHGPVHVEVAKKSNLPVMKLNVLEAPSWQMPNQENRLALVLDPLTDHVPFTFGVEMFPSGHITPEHVHETAHEMFFVLSGHGTAVCNGATIPIQAGDCAVFPPGSVHGINASSKMYCLELMLPNEQFAEFVHRGIEISSYDEDDSCVLAAIGCR